MSDERFDSWGDTPGGRAAGAGRNTLKRSVLAATLLRSTSKEQPGLLGRIASLADKYLDASLRGIYYSKSDKSANPEITTGNVQSTVDRTKGLGDEVRKQFGIEPAALTADEAAYLVGFRSPDALASAAASGRQARQDRLRSRGVQGSSPEEGLDPGTRASRAYSGAGYSALRGVVEADTERQENSLPTRTEAAIEAGLSEHQRKTALRVATDDIQM